MEWIALFGAALALWQMRRLKQRVGGLEERVVELSSVNAKLQREATKTADRVDRLAADTLVARAADASSAAQRRPSDVPQSQQIESLPPGSTAGLPVQAPRETTDSTGRKSPDSPASPDSPRSVSGADRVPPISSSVVPPPAPPMPESASGDAFSASLGANTSDRPRPVDAEATSSFASASGDNRVPPDLPRDPPSDPPTSPINWESWLGVRGAGALGGIVLALAGIYFFKYSIEHGLIPPAARVAMGVLLGLGCVLGSEFVLRKRYALNANAVAGAGLVILYASFWAAKALYHLVPFPVAFVSMIVVTGAACALSIRHASLLVAMLGLVGGFATPLLLSTGEDRPIPLFGYILLLDAAILYVAQKRGWRVLASVSFVLTFLYQAAWIFDRMTPERLFIGIIVVAVFAVAFALSSRLMKTPASRLESASLLLPFVFTVYFSASKTVSPHFYPVALLMALLLAAAGIISRGQQRPMLFTGAASATLASSFFFLTSHQITGALTWEVVVMLLLLAAVAHVFVEWQKQLLVAAPVLALGQELFAIGAASDSEKTPWPWMLLFAGSTALVLRQARFGWRRRLEIVAGGLSALGVSILVVSHHPDHLPLVMAAILALIIALHASQSFSAAAAASVVTLFFALDHHYWRGESAFYFHAYTLLLALLGGIAAARLQRGLAYLVVAVELAFVQSMWTGNTTGGDAILLSPDAVGFPFQVMSVLALTAWPFLARRRFQRDSFAWYASALAGPLFFTSLRKLFVGQFGSDFIAVLPLALGAISLLAATYASRLWSKDDPMRKTSLVWFGAVALCFVSVAIPLQLEKQWITIGWALEGAAVMLLWQRLDHPGLKYFGTALLTAAAVRLSINPEVLSYYPHEHTRIFNWLLYSYWVPTACLLYASAVLGKSELQRVTALERRFVYAWREWPWASIVTGAFGAVVFFAWINLAIADWFTTGTELELDFSRMPARELTRSICWAVYAMALLAAGVWRQSRGLRWLSLAMLYITIGKVFFWDLGELDDLYRVMSLVGAAFALIAVSLGYQRFVFRRQS